MAALDDIPANRKPLPHPPQRTRTALNPAQERICREHSASVKWGSALGSA